VNFINLGSWELVLIIVIAILAVGPKRLVQIVRTIQKWAAQARRISRQLMGSLQSELDAADDLKATAQDAVEAVREIQRGMTETINGASGGGEALTETAQEATTALKGLREDLKKLGRQVEANADADEQKPEADE
jgi:sec-independent protein translocase protein TatB